MPQSTYNVQHPITTMGIVIPKRSFLNITLPLWFIEDQNGCYFPHYNKFISVVSRIKLFPDSVVREDIRSFGFDSNTAFRYGRKVLQIFQDCVYVYNSRYSWSELTSVPNTNFHKDGFTFLNKKSAIVVMVNV